jgi:protein O-mannosyl-transferase
LRRAFFVSTIPPSLGNGMREKGTKLLSLASANGAALALTVSVLLASILAYSVAFSGPLFFDDLPNLLDNVPVQIDGASLDDWRVAALSSDAGILLRPVSMLTFALNYVAVGEFSAFSLKATNFAIHLLIGLLIYLFAQALLQSPALRDHKLSPDQRRLVALIAASIWVLHPIHVSTVLYAVQRMAQLSTMFTLVGLLVFTRYRLRWATLGAGPGELLAASLWLFLIAALAVLSKENGALLPWLLAVVEVTLFRGIWHGQSQQRLLWLGWLVFVLPLMLLIIVYVLAPEVLLGRYGGRNFTLSERLLTQGRALWQYVSWMMLPNIMDMGFFHDDIPISRSLWSPFSTFLSLLGWLVVLGAALLWRRRYPLFAFAVLFYLVAHSMESTVFPLEMVFEHRNYLPSVGLAVLVALGILNAAIRVQRLRLRIALVAVLGLLAALLFIRTSAWSDELSLARYNVVNHPQSARANFFYATALFKRFSEAQELGLDEEEKRALAVTARRYFEKMHAIDEQAFAATVMLYQLDTLYFPGLAQQNDWLAMIGNSAKTHRLQSSDFTALNALVEFSLKPQVGAEQEAVGALLQQLVARHPGNMTLLGLQYRYVIATQPEQRASLLPLLQGANELNPNSRQAAALLAQYHGSDDLAATYEAIRDLMKRDQLRRELPVVLKIFKQ